MSEKKSRQRRRLNATIPNDKKREMKAEIGKRHLKMQDERLQLKRKFQQDANERKQQFLNDVHALESDYETDRANIIEKYETEFGVRIHIDLNHNPQVVADNG